MSRNGTILVVDDEPFILENTSRLLRDQGHEVHTCHMWPSVANVVRQHEPDLILLDYNMPGLRGDDLCQILKRNIKGTRIILFSAEEESDLVRIVSQCGADGYIRKCTPAHELVQLVWTYLR